MRKVWTCMVHTSLRRFVVDSTQSLTPNRLNLNNIGLAVAEVISESIYGPLSRTVADGVLIYWHSHELEQYSQMAFQIRLGDFILMSNWIDVSAFLAQCSYRNTYAWCHSVWLLRFQAESVLMLRIMNKIRLAITAMACVNSYKFYCCCFKYRSPTMNYKKGTLFKNLYEYIFTTGKEL